MVAAKLSPISVLVFIELLSHGGPISPFPLCIERALDREGKRKRNAQTLILAILIGR